VYRPLWTFEWQPIFTKLGLYIMAPAPISMAYFISIPCRC
jgi:hypothetical protein